MLVAADPLARGFYVYAPIAQTTAPIDLMAIRRGSSVCERIEVRCGKRGVNGLPVFTRKPAIRADEVTRYAVVLTGEPVVYVPPFPDE